MNAPKNLVDAKLGQCINCDQTVMWNGKELRHVDCDSPQCTEIYSFDWFYDLPVAMHIHSVTVKKRWFRKPKTTVLDFDLYSCPACGAHVRKREYYTSLVMDLDFAEPTDEQWVCPHRPVAQVSP